MKTIADESAAEGLPENQAGICRSEKFDGIEKGQARVGPRPKPCQATKSIARGPKGGTCCSVTSVPVDNIHQRLTI
jgi:hypothetical protein